MKKTLVLLVAISMVCGLSACGGSSQTDAGVMKVAMVTDYGDITDQSFNQTAYEAIKGYCEENGIAYSYYRPNGDSTAERVAMVDKAVADGFTVLVLPGFVFGETIAQVADIYPETTFIALDVAESSLGEYTLPENAFSAVYQEELSGYMAGYAAVKLGYKHLGYLGGMASPAVLRFGYGFVQGVDAAAAELGVADEIIVEWAYGNQFHGDADITAVMDTWYGKKGVECVFACGGGIYTSVAEAASKVGGKIIGVDVDQAAVIDTTYGEGMTVTSAMKGLALTVRTMLSEVAAGNFKNYGGKVMTMGLVSGNPADNYVQLAPSTQYEDGKFTEADYEAMVAGMYNGDIVVSNDITVMPEVDVIINDYGNLK